MEWHRVATTARARPIAALRARGLVGDFLLTALLGPAGPEGDPSPAPTIGAGPWHLRVLSIRQHEPHRYLTRAFATEEAARVWAACFEHPALVHDAGLSFEERSRHADEATGLAGSSDPAGLTGPGDAESLSA